MGGPKFIRWFSELGIEDIPSVGGKNASLGEMFQHLTPKGIRVPNGFAITADAYFYFLNANHLEAQIQALLFGLNTQESQTLVDRGSQIRNALLNAQIPLDLAEEIKAAYHQLGELRDVAVRSSATAEDLPEASFAGAQETYLNVRGDEDLMVACRECFASLFTDRAISYRQDKGFDHIKVGLSIGVQEMVRSDLASSGVMFSIDTETGFTDVVVINASYGLGEMVVKGAVNPDEFYVFKPTLTANFKPIIQKKLGDKALKMVYDLAKKNGTKIIEVSEEAQHCFSISEADILTLSQWACLIEDHYSQRAGKPVPMDIEWAKDGNSGALYIVQARAETVQSHQKSHQVIEQYTLLHRSEVLLEGRSIGEKIACGPVRVIQDVKNLSRLQAGEVLVTDKTDPDWEPAMKKAAAVITNRGGRTCHAAIVSRELGLAAIVGTEIGTEKLETGQKVTVSCAEGETGFVYAGELDYKIKKIDISSTERPPVKIMMNVGNPDEAFRLSFIPNDGVGLARLEFIISNAIQIHPLALVHFNQIEDLEVRNKIETLTRGYMDKTQYFVDKLAEGVGTIAAAFYPKEVIVRLSDFKTNEYANLIGGKPYEPKEENPMLGFRGASRYYNPRYQAGFALECAALKKVRNVMGLTNVKLMIPFCRTVEEGRLVIAEMEKNGLKRGENGLEVYVMCEIPSNVILADQFAKVFDGFSIGSNDLTQLVLGVDRDSAIVAPIFDERNEAVKMMISQVIRDAHQNGRKIGICGQAPSDYPEFAQFLVKEGIDSLSLNPDSVMSATLGFLGHVRISSDSVGEIL